MQCQGHGHEMTAGSSEELLTAEPSIYCHGGLNKDTPRRRCQNGQRECPGTWTIGLQSALTGVSCVMIVISMP